MLEESLFITGEKGSEPKQVIKSRSTNCAVMHISKVDSPMILSLYSLHLICVILTFQLRFVTPAKFELVTNVSMDAWFRFPTSMYTCRRERWNMRDMRDIRDLLIESRSSQGPWISYLLCCPVLDPQMIGEAAPAVDETRNWSSRHWPTVWGDNVGLLLGPPIWNCRKSSLRLKHKC